MSDQPGAVEITAPFPRLEAICGVFLSAYLPWAGLIVAVRNPALALPGQGILSSLCFLPFTAVFLWGVARALRMGLRLDYSGVTVRNFFHVHRFSWTEVQCFADAVVDRTSESGTTSFWAVKVMLHDGRVVTAKGTMRKKVRPEVLVAIQQAAAPHAIPAELTGKLR